MTDTQAIKDAVIETIRTIKDPEIPINIYDLGLIYAVEVDETRNVSITMTLTSPNCPVAEALPSSVRTRVREIPGVVEARVDLVFDPPWSPEMMSEDAKLALDYAGPGGFEAKVRKSAFTGLTVNRRSGGP